MKKSISVTYPLLKDDSRSMIGKLMTEKALAPNAYERAKQADSIANLMNAVLKTNAKEIKVTGIGITDNLLSVYNEQGIKVAALFDANKVLTYEISIPVKYVKFGIENQGKFHYHILLNGLTAQGTEVEHQTPEGVVTVSSIPHGLIGNNYSEYDSISNTTDFWGDYIWFK